MGGRIYVRTYVADVVLCERVMTRVITYQVFDRVYIFAEIASEAFEQMTCARGRALVSAHAHTTMFWG